jgi:hypothetical protein
MKPLLNKIIYLILFFISLTNGFTQNIAIKKRVENVLINKDTSFVKNITITLKANDNPIIYPIFYDEELEKIEEIKVFKKKGKRFKLEKNIFIKEEDVQLDYTSSKKVKLVVIPFNSEAKISYTVKCPELMYFSDLRFFSNNDIDTLKYQIKVPNTFRFIHNTIHKNSLNHLSIDSIKIDNFTKWNINVTPKKVAPNPLMLFGIYKNMKEPLMRTLIIPADYEGKEKKYMNDWYLHKVKTRRGFDFDAAHKIDELTKGVTDPNKITEILYSYVKNNFKYVAIEIGMGAFIPTHVNEVFRSKQGDCKDLSNFLSEALNYKGIKSNIALAATFHHISDCDFPSLSSANHVICLTYIDGKPILLDPTDPIHLAGNPVQSIQKRSILIINSEGGSFYKTPMFTPQQNLINYEIALKENTKSMLMQGTFKVSYRGISGNFLKRNFTNIDTEKEKSVGIQYYESVFSNQTISNLKTKNNANSIDTEGKIIVNGKIINDGDNRFLFIDFLPKLFETKERETLLEGTNLGSNFKKKINLEIKMDEPFKTFTPIIHTFSNNGISLNIKISSPTEFIIKCTYEFIFDHVFIDKENIKSTNKILTSFKKIINEPIIFKEKGK